MQQKEWRDALMFQEEQTDAAEDKKKALSSWEKYVAQHQTLKDKVTTTKQSDRKQKP